MFEKIARVMRRALEHQVFKEMGKASLVTFFIFGTDVVPKIYRHDRQLWLAAADDIEAVAERRFRESEIRRGGRSRSSAGI